MGKEIEGEGGGREIGGDEVYGCSGGEMVEEMKGYEIDFGKVKKKWVGLEVRGWIEERGRFRDGEWGEVGKELMEGMGVGKEE